METAHRFQDGCIGGSRICRIEETEDAILLHTEDGKVTRIPRPPAPAHE